MNQYRSVLKASRYAYDRALHLLDVENLAGVPPDDASCECYTAALAEYLHWVPVSEKDQIVWGSNPNNILKATHIAGHLLVRTRSGADGADEALCEYVYGELGMEKVRQNYSGVYVASGDHAFADLVKDLRLHDVPVSVVGRARQVAQVLGRAAAGKVIYLPEHYHRSEALMSLADAAIIESFLRRRIRSL